MVYYYLVRQNGAFWLILSTDSPMAETPSATNYEQTGTVEQVKSWAVSIYQGGLSNDLDGLHDLGRKLEK